MKRLFNIVYICLFALACGLVLNEPVYAEGGNMQIEPRMTSISSYSTELTISKDGIASITGFVRGKLGVSNTYVKVTLQQQVSSNWINLESWENSSNTRSTTISKTYEVSSGTYRVFMTCSADEETKTLTSSERTY